MTQLFSKQNKIAMFEFPFQMLRKAKTKGKRNKSVIVLVFRFYSGCFER